MKQIILFALFLAAVVWASANVASAPARGHGQVEYGGGRADETRAFALFAAKQETARWVEHWKELEPVETVKGEGARKFVTETFGYGAKVLGRCKKSLPPYTCSQQQWASSKIISGPSGPDTSSSRVCTVVSLIVGHPHPHRREAHFGIPGLRSFFDVPSNEEFVAVENQSGGNVCPGWTTPPLPPPELAPPPAPPVSE